ncbi:MAG: Methyltransferase type 11 [Microgenomates group bacterium Gr01-1014_5]|nr:MAG: Methyltransferase type 11 [Microgenomates group bacterium Gr01-1014_5]
MTPTEYLMHYVGLLIPAKWKDYLKHIVKWEVFSERIIENPIIIQNLPREKSKILDVGSRYSQVPLEMASLGHEVWALDIEEYLFKHKNLKFVKGDIRKTKFERGFFDAVTIISTLEHVGMGETSYGDVEERDGDITAMAEIRRVLKPGGIVLITVPFGKAKFLPFLRVYDKARIKKISQGFKVIEEIYMLNDKENWGISTYDKVKNIENTHHTIGNAFFMLQKTKNPV